jgi:hypothetical protein
MYKLGGQCRTGKFSVSIPQFSHPSKKKIQVRLEKVVKVIVKLLRKKIYYNRIKVGRNRDKRERWRQRLKMVVLICGLILS